MVDSMFDSNVLVIVVNSTFMFVFLNHFQSAP